jgi:hypothetical protein
MPVIRKDHAARLKNELSTRFDVLERALGTRELRSNSEGSLKGPWAEPDKLCITYGSAMDLRLAAEGFAAILKEIKQIK